MADIFELFKKIGTGNTTTAGTPEYIIVGLGNPGDKYITTRHNAGYMALDYISGRLSCDVRTLKFHALIGDASLPLGNGESVRVLLMKPQTFMNLSGQAVVKVLNFFKADFSDLLVLYDDLDIDIGLLRFRASGSSGTHNGMRNIIALLGSGEFARARIGTKKDNPQIPTLDYVLMKIPAEREELLSKATDKAVLLSIDFIKGESAEKIMCAYNGK